MFKVGGFGEVPEQLARHPQVRVSSLMDYALSPAHFESAAILGEKKETKAMALGTAVHAAILEPDKFARTYCRAPDGIESCAQTVEDLKALAKELLIATQTKWKRQDYVDNILHQHPHARARIADTALADHVGDRTILSDDDWKAIERIKRRVAAAPDVRALLSGGEAEQAGWALHEESGLVVTFHTDYVKTFKTPYRGRYKGAVVDVKKTRAADQDGFALEIAKRRLHVQAAAYADLQTALRAGAEHTFVWVAVEAAPPYSVCAWECDEGLMSAGQAAYTKALLGIAEGFRTGRWPVYSERIRQITIPSWAWARMEDEPTE